MHINWHQFADARMPQYQDDVDWSAMAQDSSHRTKALHKEDDMQCGYDLTDLTSEPRRLGARIVAPRCSCLRCVIRAGLERGTQSRPIARPPHRLACSSSTRSMWLRPY